MTIRIGINGFGRMGRLVLRAAWSWPELDFVHINETGGGADLAAHLLQFDSVHGRWDHTADHTEHSVVIGDRRLGYTQHATPGAVPWDEAGVDVVMECTGQFRSRAALAPYFDRGVRKVLVAAPVKEPDVLNVVMGVNHALYDPARHDIVTAASCTTNCLAPVVKAVHEGIGIRHGVITTIHDVTNTQTVVDRPHKDLRRARSSLLNLIPTSTGSATAIGLIYPELLGKLSVVAVRVPLLNASLTDCVFETARATSVDEVNGLLRAAADGPLSGILGYEPRPLVSTDYVGDTRSAIIDAGSTMVVDDTQLKLLAWYDNEIGYVHRLAELAQLVAGSL